jgi:branched-chain amino acid transport system permease protein
MTFDLAVVFQLFSDGIIRGSMYGLMGMGMALIFGIMGLINFAHGELFMIGAYVMYFVVVGAGLPPWLGIMLAALALFLFGIALERGLVSPLRRRLGENWLVDGYVLTIGLLIVLQNLALLIFGAREFGIATLVSGRFHIGRVIITYEHLAIFLAAIATVTAFALFMRYTYTGRAIRATAENHEAAQALGIDVRRSYTITFGLGAALIGGVGGLLISTYPAMPTVGGDILLKAFVVVVIGGLGNVWAALLAGTLLGVIESYSTVFASGGWQNAIIAALVLVVLGIRPAGLFSKSTTRP